MILTYPERKEAVLEDYQAFHKDLGYSINQTLYASLGESEPSKDFSQTDECCIYLNFALIFLEKKESINFMKDKLNELLDERYTEMYKSDLGNEYQEFLNDVDFLKRFL